MCTFLTLLQKKKKETGYNFLTGKSSHIAKSLFCKLLPFKGKRERNHRQKHIKKNTCRLTSS